MARPKVVPTGREIRFDPDEIIVSKTDTRGRLTYCNDVFLRVAGYAEAELLGQPHSIIRHPDMPRCVFKLLWEAIQGGQEIFAYVKNMTKSGDHYWVLAHVTASFDDGGRIVGYHSNRRVPARGAVERIERLYADLRAAEAKPASRKDGPAAGERKLQDLLAAEGISYDAFIFSL